MTPTSWQLQVLGVLWVIVAGVHDGWKASLALAFALLIFLSAMYARVREK